MKVLICGRGESLKYYKKLKDKKFDYIYLINDFNIFIRQDAELLSFFQANKNAKIIQQVNICIQGVDSFLLKNLSIHECRVARCPHIPGSSHWVDDKADTTKFMRQGLDIEVKPYPSLLRNHIVDLEVSNSLPVAIIDAAITKGCEEVTVLGADFYETGYYLNAPQNWTNENTKPTQDRLKSGMTRVCKEFADVKFNFYTCSEYTNLLDNCNIVKIDIDSL